MADISGLRPDLEKAFEHLQSEFKRIRTGRASLELVEDIKVEAYGGQMELKGVATLGVSDATTISVQPWDKTLTEAIADALSKTDFGLLVSIDGDIVRARVPELTQERREEYVKLAKQKAEQARVTVRQIRQQYMKDIENSVKEGLSEDEGKRLEDEVEKTVKEYNEKIKEALEAKEKDIMTV